jgi:replicative DNA helicase
MKRTLPIGVSYPRSVYEVVTDFNQRLRDGKLSYRPIPTGFMPLDTYLGGGLQAEDLVLLGGPQGVGKTVAVLQMARNIARDGRALAIVVCFEHSEIYLLLRLLSMESIQVKGETMDGMTRKALRDAILRAMDAQEAGWTPDRFDIGLEWVLANIPGAERAFNQIADYWQRLHLVRGSSRSTTVEVLETYIEKAREDGYQDVVLFVDYLQKVPYRPPIGAPDPDTTQRIGHVVGGLKDVALGTGVPIVAVAASDEAGLRSGKVRLADLLGPSLVQYECDVGIIQNPHDVGIEGRQTVLWTIEKKSERPDRRRRIALLAWRLLLLRASGDSVFYARLERRG